MKPFYVAALLLCPFAALAQNDIKKVKVEQDMKEVFSASDLFHNPQFTAGRVTFKDGTTGDALLNYNKYYNEMLFIDGKGDTLALANPELVQVITIGKDSFYYHKEAYIRQCGQFGNITLGSREMLKEIDQQKNSAYGGTTTSASSVSFKREYTVYGNPVQLQPGESTLFARKKELYISDNFKQFVPVTRKNLEKMFHNKTKDLKAYLSEREVKLDHEEDLQALIRHMQSL